MCGICGCGGEDAVLVDLTTGTDAHTHGHPHPHGHPHHDHEHGEHGHDHGGRVIGLEAQILAKNDARAERNRGWFLGREILALNLVGGPGAGKTALIERTIADFKDEAPLFVVEGDQAGALDAERIRRAGAPVAQLNTGTGCHLDAAMVAGALAELKPHTGAVVLIENVGNLVCPALFDLGEHAKVVLFSVTEGEEKPLKYPHMFRAASLVLLSKVDLLPHLDFDAARAVANVRRANPAAPVLQVSARTGEGVAEWYDWLRRQMIAVREAAFA